MKNKKQYNKEVILLIFFIILSILLHLAILLELAKIETKNKSEKKIKKTKIKIIKKKNNIPAALKPKKSTFGIPDKFKNNTPENRISSFKKNESNKNQKLKTNNDKQTKSENKIEYKESKPNQKSITKNNHKKRLNIIKKKKNKILKKQEVTEQSDKRKKEAYSAGSEEKQKNIENNTKESNNLKKEAEYKESKIEKPKIKNSSTLNFNHMNINIKKKIKKKKSILKLTKGFLQNLKNEGNDWLKRNGDENKRPSLEELKYLSYDQKIAWNFQNETRILYNQLTLREKSLLFSGFKSNPLINFKLDTNGNLIMIKLLKSSGSRNFDKHVIKAFKQASPFPSIPKHLNLTTYDKTVIIQANR